MKYSYKSASARHKQRQQQRKRRKRIEMAVAAVFISLNILVAVIFWPKLQKYREDVKSGKIQPVLKIEIGGKK